jgi:predicted NBD/HSP70 family sugar kinase
MIAHDAPGTVLALDLGGTNLRAGLLPEGADPADTELLAVRAAPQELDEFEATIRDLLTAAEQRSQVDRIGLAVPGTATVDRGVWVPKLPYLDGVVLGDLIGLPVTVGNDAQLALLGEATAGAAVGRHDVVLLAVGTGIGSAVLAGGRIVTGAHGAACSIGWLSLDPDDAGHPRHGWLERHAAGPSFDRVAVDLGDPSIGDAAALMAAASTGEPAAQAAVAGPARLLGTAIAGVVALLDPELILLAGGVAAAFEVLEPHIREALEQHTPAHLHGVTIEVGRFGPRAGLVGAAVAGRRRGAWMEVGR